MKRVLVLCLSGWLVAGASGAEPPEPKPAPLTKEQQEKLKERDRLLDEGKRLFADNQVDRAMALGEKALAITQEVRGEQHAEALNLCQTLAQGYEQQANFAAAKKLRQQVLAIQTKVHGKDHWMVTDARLALEGVERLARLAPADRRLLAEAVQLNGRVVQLYQQGKTPEAFPLAQKALEIRKQVLGERHPDYANSLNNLAALYDSQGQHAKAEPLHRQALEIRHQVLGERHPHYAISLSNLAGLYQALGAYAPAEPLYRQALAALRQRPEGQPLEFGQLTAADLCPLPETVTVLAHYCVFLEQRLGPAPTTAQLRAADHAFAVALAVRERLRQEVLQQDASKLLHGTKAQDLIPGRIGLCQRLFDRESTGADLESALATAEQGTARVFLEQLGKARAQAVGGVSPELRAQETALRRQLRELDGRIAKEQDKPTDKRDPDKVGQLLDEQKQTEVQLSALIRRMAKDYPQYAALKHPRPCSLAEARACLTATEVALLFVPGEARSYLIVVEARPAAGDKADGLAIYPLPGKDDLADGVSGLTDRDTFESQVKARAAAVQAYELLLAPVKDRIRGKDLVIVPGGPLAYVPFEALVEDGRYLIENHRIRYAPSLTALHLVRLWEKTRSKPERPLWAMADPIYEKADPRVEGEKDLAQATQDALAKYLNRADRGPAGGEAYARLHFTGQEAAAIRARLGAADSDVLTGLQATEAAVKAASAKGLLARARYVHFATHGILGLDTGQPPALVLSLVGNDGARDEEGGVNDGFLRLDEVTRLQLNADLVVLSACETGKGKLYAGEGVTGLARAFLYAGSRGVVCSLWAVDDRETANFMAQLYSGLKDGKAAADALRAAKLEMIRDHKPPVYWAPFILIGE
jgi:CHAT domain-containing protein